MAEAGGKSPKKHQNAKSHNSNIPRNFVGRSCRKEDKKQISNKPEQLVDLKVSKTKTFSQNSKYNYREQVKSENVTPDESPSRNSSPSTSSGSQEVIKGKHVKNKGLVSGLCSNNAKPIETLKDNMKLTSKNGKDDLSNTDETGDLSDIEKSFKDLVVDSSKEENGDAHITASCDKVDKVEHACSKQVTPPKSKDGKKEKDRLSYRKDLQEERNKFWLRYFNDRPTDLLILAFHKMNELQKVDAKQQQAQFRCGVCQYYCNSMAIVRKHIKEERHNNNIKRLLDNSTVKILPPLPTSHTDFQTIMLEGLYAQHGMTEKDCTERQAIVKYIDVLVQEKLPGCSVRMFGSSVHCLGLKTSDLNIDLHVSGNWVASKALCLVAELITKDAAFRDVKRNFTEKIPTIVFTQVETEVVCVISLNNERPVLLAALIAKYTHFHPILRRLTTIFRLWGKLAKVDQQDKGLWPSYALYLLVIFYLQHCDEPVLPVLNDFVSSSVSDNPSQSESNEFVLKLDIDEVKSKWQSKNTQTFGELWVSLLKFYASNCDSPDYVVSIDNSEPKFRQAKRINIVDPFMPKRNVTRTVSCASLYYYIAHCLKTTYRHFGVPQTKQGPIFGNILEDLVPIDKYKHHKDVFEAQNSVTSQLIRLIPLVDKNYILSDKTEDEAYREVSRILTTKPEDFINFNNINVKLVKRTCPNEGQYKNLIVSPLDAQYLISQLDPTMLDFKFNSYTFTGGMAVPLVCEVCKEEGHIKDVCPVEKLLPLEKLPPVDRRMIVTLDATCLEVYNKWIPSTWELYKREEILNTLQEYISSIYPTAVLTLFGSTKNGFGSRRSDLDICLTFNEEDGRKGLKVASFIETLGDQLKNCSDLKNVLIISSAKVPIIKFEHTESQLEGDISLYNILGQENTQLLRSYTEIDDRVTPLGFMMKKFAKLCHIGDASKGGLSSYAYSLMVIYFLQHCSPPVLPVLQELHEGDGPCPEVLIDGCNTYYFKDLHKLSEVWKNRERNTSSVGLLWLQLLRFYTEIFDIENHVISIRTYKTVTKFEKLWISKCFTIEDPFDVAHNLGSALTRNMNVFIIKVLRKGRKVFGTPIYYIPNHCSIQALYFNTADLQVLSPPNDRGCRFCKTIGHVVKDCPAKQAVAERKGILNNNTKNEGNTTAASEDSKESENSIAISDSVSSSSDNTEDKMLLSKFSKPRDAVDYHPWPVGMKRKSKLPKADFQSSVDQLLLEGPSHLNSTTVKETTVSSRINPQISSKTNHLQHHLVGVPLVRTQNPLGSNEVPPIQTNADENSEGGTSKKQADTFKTLVYTNSNFKQNVKPGYLSPTDTASNQIPSSMVYTNTNYRNDKRVPTTEKDQSHEAVHPFSEIIHQQQRFPGSVGNAIPGSGGTSLHFQYENGRCMPSITSINIGYLNTTPVSNPAIPSMFLRHAIPSPLSSSDPRLGHPLINHMTNPIHSVPHMGSVPCVNNNFPRKCGSPHVQKLQVTGPQVTPAGTSRNVHIGNGLNNSAHIEETHHEVSGKNNPVTSSAGGSTPYLPPPFSVLRALKAENVVQPRRKYVNKKHDYENELKQLEKRARLLTRNLEYSIGLAGHSNKSEIEHSMTHKKIQKGRNCHKHWNTFSNKQVGGDQIKYENAEMQDTESNVTPLNTDSSSSDD